MPTSTPYCEGAKRLVVKVSEVKVKVKSEKKKVIRFWSFIFPETYICYRGYFNINYYISKKVQKNFIMGLKI